MSELEPPAANNVANVNPPDVTIRVCSRPQCDKGIWVILAEVGAGCVATRVGGQPK